jgi:hypothetical protein
LLEKSVGCCNSLLSVRVQPEQLQLTLNHQGDFVTIGSSPSTTTNHIWCQGMDFHAIFVGNNVTGGGTSISANNYTMLENSATNCGASFGKLWHLQVGHISQKCISKKQK